MQSCFIAYNTALFTFDATRKHFFSDKKYFVYVFVDGIVLSDIQQDPKPKYVLKFSLAQRIGWIVETINQKNLILKAFTFVFKTMNKDFFADNLDLQKMKLLLANKVNFYKIADFYLPQYVIGKGSSAIVLLAIQFTNNSQYAIKSIDKAYLRKSDDGMESFESEVEIMKTLSVYNTEKQKYFLTLHEIFEGDLTYYLIVDLMEGKTLHAELDRIKKKEEKVMKMKSVRLIMKQLLEGVKIMHDIGIIHRDLKPDNIMFATPDDYSSVRIVDYGLATLTDIDAFQFPKCGTPGYCAPEILNLKNRREKYSSVCDIFSLGCIFYKLITCNNLFAGSQFQDVLDLNKACEIDFSAHEFQDMPPEGLQLIQWMLQRDPARRITAELALMHEFFQQESPIIYESPKQKLDLIIFEPEFIMAPVKLSTNVQKRVILDSETECSPFIRNANHKKYSKSDIKLTKQDNQELEDSDQEGSIPEKTKSEVEQMQYLKDKLLSLDKLFNIHNDAIIEDVSQLAMNSKQKMKTQKEQIYSPDSSDCSPIQGPRVLIMNQVSLFGAKRSTKK